MACSNLLTGESDMVLAGGVSVEVPQKIGHLYQEGMIISPDGHCRAFDANAQGTIFGSGAGLVLLKRLEDAIADEDHIYAVCAIVREDTPGDRRLVAYVVSDQNSTPTISQLRQFLLSKLPGYTISDSS